MIVCQTKQNLFDFFYFLIPINKQCTCLAEGEQNHSSARESPSSRNHLESDMTWGTSKKISPQRLIAAQRALRFVCGMIGCSASRDERHALAIRGRTKKKKHRTGTEPFVARISSAVTDGEVLSVLQVKDEVTPLAGRSITTPNVQSLNPKYPFVFSVLLW